jgi:hypothetical protein
MMKTYDGFLNKYNKYLDDEAGSDERLELHRQVMAAMYTTITECKFVDILAAGGSAKSRRDKLAAEIGKIAGVEQALQNPIKEKIFEPIFKEVQSIILEG